MDSDLFYCSSLAYVVPKLIQKILKLIELTVIFSSG